MSQIIEDSRDVVHCSGYLFFELGFAEVDSTLEVPQAFLTSITCSGMGFESVRARLAADLTAPSLVCLHVVDAKIEIRFIVLRIHLVGPVQQL